MITGIYKITNNINGHLYIGQSVDIKARFRQHIFSALHPKDKDHNTPIHLALYKYGQKNFSFEIIEECSRELLDEREVYWIEKLQATSNGNYNILKGGQDRMKFDNKPVELYDLQGNYIRTIESATKVAEELQVQRSTIYQVLHGLRPTCRGYQMKYQEKIEQIMTPFISCQGGTKKVVQLNKYDDSVIQIFNSIAEAARLTQTDSSAISKACNGKLKSTNGYKWRYYKDWRNDLSNMQDS